jgi:hypothetical protein
MKRTIIQASDLKETLEKLQLMATNCTIVSSIDAQDYYPSVHFKLVRKALRYYSQHLSLDLQDIIDECLGMISFGMNSTLFTFQGRYYEYDGDGDEDDRGLTIDGYESAWLADLVGAYILDNTRHLFRDTLFDGFYRDDGFAVFKGLKSYGQLSQWRKAFQDEVNRLAEGDYLQYSLSIWLDSTKRITPCNTYNPQTSVVTDHWFPYLDMELYWGYNPHTHAEPLQFRVHLKPNQQLKYLNRDSRHTTACFKAIPSGVCTRLAKLTTPLPQHEGKTLADLYPKHFQQLTQSGLVTQPVPTLAEELERYKEANNPEAKQSKKRRQ